MDFPQVFTFDAGDGEEEASRELSATLSAISIEAPFVLAGVHGGGLAGHLKPTAGHDAPPPGADQEWASSLGSRVRRSGADAIVAIGGGRCLDVAKLAAARAGVVVVAAPTQLSHDGICSPVAVVPNSDGRTESLGAVAPRAVFLSIPTIVGAPVASVAAGLGDLLANPLALRDWSLAADRGLSEIDQRAWDLSIESFARIESHLGTDPAESAGRPQFLRELADALVLSGMAMICSGTSRPASGAEHEISHAIDQIHGGRGLHGAQVAFGCILSVELYGEDTGAFRDRLTRLGLPQHPRELGLDLEDVVRIVLEAPDTRQGRFTILENADLDEAGARALVERIWNPV